jgi:hypothetical protein
MMEAVYRENEITTNEQNEIVFTILNPHILYDQPAVDMRSVYPTYHSIEDKLTNHISLQHWALRITSR